MILKLISRRQDNSRVYEDNNDTIEANVLHEIEFNKQTSYKDFGIEELVQFVSSFLIKGHQTGFHKIMKADDELVERLKGTERTVCIFIKLKRTQKHLEKQFDDIIKAEKSAKKQKLNRRKKQSQHNPDCRKFCLEFKQAQTKLLKLSKKKQKCGIFECDRKFSEESSASEEEPTEAENQVLEFECFESLLPKLDDFSNQGLFDPPNPVCCQAAVDKINDKIFKELIRKLHADGKVLSGEDFEFDKPDKSCYESMISTDSIDYEDIDPQKKQVDGDKIDSGDQLYSVRGLKATQWQTGGSELTAIENATKKGLNEENFYHCTRCADESGMQIVLLNEKHKRDHDSKVHQIVSCQRCQVEYDKNGSALRNHRQHHHFDGHKFQCHQCGQLFKNMSNYDSHVYNQANKACKYLCNKGCGSLFNDIIELKAHACEPNDLRKKATYEVVKVTNYDQLTAFQDSLENDFNEMLYGEKKVGRFSSDQIRQMAKQLPSLFLIKDKQLVGHLLYEEVLDKQTWVMRVRHYMTISGLEDDIVQLFIVADQITQQRRMTEIFVQPPQKDYKILQKQNFFFKKWNNLPSGLAISETESYQYPVMSLYSQYIWRDKMPEIRVPDPKFFKGDAAILKQNHDLLIKNNAVKLLTQVRDQKYRSVVQEGNNKANPSDQAITPPELKTWINRKLQTTNSKIFDTAKYDPEWREDLNFNCNLDDFPCWIAALNGPWTSSRVQIVQASIQALKGTTVILISSTASTKTTLAKQLIPYLGLKWDIGEVKYIPHDKGNQFTTSVTVFPSPEYLQYIKDKKQYCKQQATVPEQIRLASMDIYGKRSPVKIDIALRLASQGIPQRKVRSLSKISQKDLLDLYNSDQLNDFIQYQESFSSTDKKKNEQVFVTRVAESDNEEPSAQVDKEQK